MLQVKYIFWCVVNNRKNINEQYFQIILQNIDSQRIHFDIGRRYYHLSPTKYIIKHLSFWIVGVHQEYDSRLEEINWENTTGKDKYIIIMGLATKAEDSYDKNNVYFSGIVSKKSTKISFINKETLEKIEEEIISSCKFLFSFKIGTKFSHSVEQFHRSYIEPIRNLIKE